MINFSKIVHHIERCFPTSFIETYRNFKWLTKKWLYQKRYSRTIAILRKKNAPINVFFFLFDSSMWKYDALYKMMQSDAMFNVSVLVCMRADLSVELALKNMKKCEQMCQQKGYNVISSYNETDGALIDPQRLNADIVFYCNPYKRFYHKKFYINYLRNSLICYANYSYEIIPFKWAFAGTMQNLAWRYFCESEEHKKMIIESSIVKGWNVINSGYPAIDEYIGDKLDDSCWKIKEKSLKRVIWAPHQSIFATEMSNKNAAVQFSTFLLFAETMLRLRDKYADKVQIAFKPHPFLKQNLYSHPNWGKEKTDAYYHDWEFGENSCLVDNRYQELFCTSDALIHDCGSFTVEYLCVRKPCMYLSVYMNENNMNPVGIKAFDSHYKGITENDIEKFIRDVVIDGNDTMEKERDDFYEEYLLPPNGCSVAENIVNEIKKELLR